MAMTSFHDSSWCRILRLSSAAEHLIIAVVTSDRQRSSTIPEPPFRLLFCYVYVVRHALVMITIRRSAETKLHLPFLRGR